VDAAIGDGFSFAAWMRSLLRGQHWLALGYLLYFRVICDSIDDDDEAPSLLRPVCGPHGNGRSSDIRGRTYRGEL
jgi:hypothetical protein